jgi:hypothetical protein
MQLKWACHGLSAKLIVMKIFVITVLLSALTFVSTHSSFQEVVLSGKWDNYSRWTTLEGNWKILKTVEGFEIVMDENFEAEEAPDLKIFLSKAVLDDITSKNATSLGSPVLVAQLKVYKGKASYKIPSSIDINGFKTMIIHCEEYGKLWGGSALK